MNIFWGAPERRLRVAGHWLLVAAVLLVVLAGRAGAQSLLQLDTDQAIRGFGQATEFLEDPGGALDLRQAQTAYTDGKFAQIDGAEPNFGLSASTYWLRFQARTPRGNSLDWVINTGKPYLRTAKVFVQEGGDTRVILDTTHFVPFHDRKMPISHVATPAFSLAPDTTFTFWVAYQSEISSSMPMAISTLPVFQKAQLSSQIALFVFYAVAATIAVFIIGMAVVLRNRVAVVYSLFYVSLLTFLAQINGSLFEFVWPGLPYLNSVISHPMACAVVIFVMLFGREYLRQVEGGGWLSFACLFVAIGAGIIAFAPLVTDTLTARKLASLVIFPMLILQLINGFFLLFKRLPGGLFFFIGTCLIFLYIGGFMSSQVLLPAEQASVFYLYFRYGQILDGIVFAISVLQLTAALRQREAEAQTLAAGSALELQRARHDLRQPLTTLRAAAEKLGQGAAGAQDLTQSVEYLGKILDGPPTDEGPVPSLTKVADNAIAMFAKDAEAAGIEMSREGDGDTPCEASFALTRVLANLLSNSIRHSGATTVSVCLGPIVAVQDNGKGLSKSALARFERAKSGGDEESLGFGIIHQIARENGWVVSVVDSGEQGTRITIKGVTAL